METVRRQIDEMSKKRDEYYRRMEASPRVEESYKALMSERNNTQLKFDDLMKKTMEAKVAQGLEKEKMGERFTIIDPARLPEKPVKPNVPAILLIGLFLGIGAGVGTASLKEFSDQSVRNPNTLTTITHLPVLVDCPGNYYRKRHPGPEDYAEKTLDRRCSGMCGWFDSLSFFYYGP